MQFDKLAEADGFEVIDATPDAHAVFRRLQEGISRVLSGEPRSPLFEADAHAGTAEKAKEKEKEGKPVAQASGKKSDQEAKR